MKNVNIRKRIKYFVDNQNITQKDFFVKTKLSRGLLDTDKLNKDVGADKITNILVAFPELNIEWLMLGRGEMLKTKNTEKGNKPNVHLNVPQNNEKRKIQKKGTNKELQPGYGRGIKLIPIEAMAGYGEGDMQVMEYETGDYIVPEFEELNVDYMIRVKGSSMYPKYNSGDIIACKKLFLSDLFFQWNKVYVLSTEQGALVNGFIKEKTKSIFV